MKILQLCHKPPLPARDGGCIAMNNVTEGLLNAGHEVKLLTIYTQKHGLKMEYMPDEYVDATRFEACYVDTSINLVDAFSNLITRDSYNISRFFSPDFDIKLSRILKREKFDIIHLESLFMTPYIGTCRRHSKAKVVLRSHNLEFIIWERMASGTKSVAKRAYLKYLSKKLREYELRVIDDVDGIAAISEEDENKYKLLGCYKPITTIPFGIELDNYKPNSDVEDKMSLFHLGSLEWSPNLEGVIWFLEDIWPNILKRFPDVKFYLAGRNIPRDIIEQDYPNLEVVGEVEDAHEFMRGKSIMIVPLLSASGIRVKIIEGMALGKAIISTEIGAEGLGAEKGKHLMVADESSQFVDSLEKLLHNNGAANVGTAAREFAETRFNNKLIIKSLIDFYTEL